MKMMSLAWVLPLALALPTSAVAATQDAPQVEASMLVNGSVQIDPNGKVTGYSLDHADALPVGVKNVIAKTVPAWTFEPAVRDGKRLAGNSRMHLRVLAKPLPEKKMALRIIGAWFGDAHGDRDNWVSYKQRRKPHYPFVARRDRVQGTVYLLLRVNRQGKVANIAAEQVNLKQLDDSHTMAQYRHLLSKAAIAAAKHWTFNLPTQGTHINDAHWDVRVPVSFAMRIGLNPPRNLHTEGTWQAYVRGPRHIPAWDSEDQMLDDSIDAMPSNGLMAAQQSRHLITPLTRG